MVGIENLVNMVLTEVIEETSEDKPKNNNNLPPIDCELELIYNPADKTYKWYE